MQLQLRLSIFCLAVFLFFSVTATVTANAEPLRTIDPALITYFTKSLDLLNADEYFKFERRFIRRIASERRHQTVQIMIRRLFRSDVQKPTLTFSERLLLEAAISTNSSTNLKDLFATYLISLDHSDAAWEYIDPLISRNGNMRLSAARTNDAANAAAKPTHEVSCENLFRGVSL